MNERMLVMSMLEMSMLEMRCVRRIIKDGYAKKKEWREGFFSLDAIQCLVSSRFRTP